MRSSGVGLVDFEVAFPLGRRTAAGLAHSSGLSIADVREQTLADSFPVVGTAESLHDVAMRAVSTIRARLPEQFAKVSTVIVGGSGHWDHPIWSPAAAIASAAGLTDVHAFEVTNFCNSYALAARLVLDAAAARPTAGMTLVVLQDKLSTVVDVNDPSAAELFNYGDGAVAILFASGHATPRYELVDAVSMTDPSWHSEYQGERVAGDTGVKLRRRGRRRGLRDRYVEAFQHLTRQLLDERGRSLDEVSVVLMNHGDRSTHERFLSTIGLPHERSFFHYGRLAHQGAVDTFIGLQGAADDGRIRPDSLVLQLSSGLGFSWGATLLKAVRP
jgi:3-oxoacyl-[acyl-carrier-protein] synthase-3